MNIWDKIKENSNFTVKKKKFNQDELRFNLKHLNYKQLDSLRKAVGSIQKDQIQQFRKIKSRRSHWNESLDSLIFRLYIHRGPEVMMAAQAVRQFKKTTWKKLWKPLQRGYFPDSAVQDVLKWVMNKKITIREIKLQP